MEKDKDVKCGACSKVIKGAQYKIKNKEGKNIWACEKCWETAE